jgi:DNA-binding MarR family transcriptional regulator
LPKPSAAILSRPGAPEAKEALVALLCAAERVKALVTAVIEPHGITGQQYNVLRILRGAGPEGLPTLTVAERIIEHAPGITRMMDRLEAKGLVTRERCGDDRRCVVCRITKPGLELLEELDRPVREANQAAFAGLSSQELSHLVELLEQVRPGPGLKP